ncbi:hypothetical protein L7F22_051105 [Adiantum nelumboides]|nr:hypothetical protein [Adiantum nelumboides]
MPLSRYEIRSEYSLANPDLYRAAEKDDPEGLLEGVAMAGLVGIIRQLGDLAEFAAEVFHDLHEHVVATAARGHELLVRVQQLEREVPLIEDLMFTKIDCGNFMYNPGVEWHVHLHYEQNHFTQGDLPRFIRSAYEDCRSPPRLFVLDRFDVTGAGACLKRFTDPSFFKMEWASSELLKAEKEQRNQKARRLKKKGQRQEDGEVREARIALHVKLRAPSVVENAEKSSIPSSSATSSIRVEQVFDSLTQENEDMLMAASSLLFSGKDGPQSKRIVVEQPTVEETPQEPLSCKWEEIIREQVTVEELSEGPSSCMREVLNMEISKDVGPLNEGPENVWKEVEGMAEDSASDTENFMDAVTTMDSDIETDTETKKRAEADFVDVIILAEHEAPELQPVSVSLREAGGEHISVEDDVGSYRKVKEVVALEDDCSSEVLTPEVFSWTDQGVLVEDSPAAFPEEEAVNDHFATSLAQTKNAFALDIPTGASASSVKEDAAAKLAELPTGKASWDFVEKTSSFVLDRSHIMPFSENNVAPASNNGSGGSSPAFEHERLSSSNRSLELDSTKQERLSSSNRSLELESTKHVATTVETLEASITKDFHGERASTFFSQHVESGVLENQNQSLKAVGAVTTRKRWQLDGDFDKVMLAPDLAVDSSQASESEQGESPKKLSLHSSPSSSIQPIKWAISTSKSYHTDEELDGLQGSLGSLSSSSSTLSSPRPSTLATTLQSLYLGGKQTFSSLPQSSVESSSPSGVCSPPKSGITTAVHERVSPANHFTGYMISSDAENSAHSSPHSSSSAVQPFFDSLPALGRNVTSPEIMGESLSTQTVGGTKMESFPPPPPLPPLAWRMARRLHSAVVGASEPVKSPTESLSQHDAEILTNQPQQAFMLSTSMTASSPCIDVDQLPVDLMKPPTYETRTSEMDSLHENSRELLKSCQLAETQGSCAASFTSEADATQEESVSVLAPSNFERENNSRALPDSSLHASDSNHTLLTRVVSTPARLDKTRLEPEAKSAGDYEVGPLASQDLLPNFEREDFGAEATTSYDINRFKRRSKWALTSNTASCDDREVLLEQIRTRSFSLRNASAGKLAGSRPVININVAAILEKANAIRQGGLFLKRLDRFYVGCFGADSGGIVSIFPGTVLSDHALVSLCILSRCSLAPRQGSRIPDLVLQDVELRIALSQIWTCGSSQMEDPVVVLPSCMATSSIAYRHTVSERR